jgi:large subunit ribosomal protein L25
MLKTKNYKGVFYMSIAQLVVEKSEEKPQKVRKDGYLPGVIYGREMKENLKVKIKYSDILSIIRNHGDRAKLQTVLDGKKHLAFIKELQKDPLSSKIIHMDIQYVSSKDIVKMKVPVIFEGISELEQNKLILEIYRQEVELSGNIENIPEFVKLSVADLKAGTQITCGDLKLDKEIEIHNSSENLAAVHKIKVVIEAEETEAEVKTAEVKAVEK